jgi:glutaconate CoA-transferase, subunit B
MTAYTDDELMTVEAARRVPDKSVCFVGIGLPSLALNLARRTHARDVVLVYESGPIGSKPTVPPLSIGDGELSETADLTVSVPELFSYWLQGGRIDVAFLGAAQIDARGNLNSTVIGSYAEPTVRLPGAGGAPEIATNARDVYVILRHSTRALVERVDFVSSVGERVRAAITDLAVLEQDPAGELVLSQLHPGVTADDVRAATGWELRTAPTLRRTAPPSDEELAALRAFTGAGAPA